MAAGDGPRDRGARPGRRRDDAPGGLGPHHGRRAGCEPGQRLRLVKFLAYGWSSRAVPAGAARPGRRRRSPAPATPAWRACWTSSGRTSTSSGTPPTSRSTATPSCSRRSGSGCSTCCRPARAAERRAIPAKGLTGPGYDGHAFWDTEGFVLPVLDHTLPEAAADALRWRQVDPRPGPGPGRAPSGWPAPRSRGGRSAAQECSGYWPAGTAAFHVNADIADGGRAAPRRHRGRRASRPSAGWRSWSRRPGCGCRSGTTTGDGQWHIVGVTGPDEYTAVVDDNVYTNLMAAAEPARGRGRGGPAPARARERLERRRARRRRPGGTRPRPCTSRTTSSSGAPAVGGLHRAAGVGLRAAPRPATRCCCTRRTSTCTAGR